MYFSGTGGAACESTPKTTSKQLFVRMNGSSGQACESHMPLPPSTTLHLLQKDRFGTKVKINRSEIESILNKMTGDDDRRIVYDHLKNGRNYMSLQIFYKSQDDASEVRNKLNGLEFFSNVHDIPVVLTVDFLRKK